MKKKKLLVFLLSASLCAAGAAGLSACEPDNPNPPEPVYPKVYNDYKTYCEYTGAEVKTYDQWLGGYAEKEYTSAENTQSDDLLFTYADGTTATVVLPKLYTVYAKDDNSNAVKDVWVSVTSTASTVVSVHYTAKTDAAGFAYFYFEPEENKVYEARLANPENISSDATQHAVPQNYKTNFGINENNIAVTSFTFDANRSVTMSFLYTVSDFFTNAKTDIGYKRVAYEGAGKGDNKLVTPSEICSPAALAVNVKGGVYSYIYFNPYLDPGMGSDQAENIDTRYANARVAAAGKYQIKINGNASLIQYDGDLNTMKTDAYGIPERIVAITGTAPAGAQNASLYTGTDYIEHNNYTSISNTSVFFGIYSESDTAVTVTVTRIDEADEPAEVPLQKVAVPENLTAFVSNERGTLVEMPVNGTVDAVKGTDGYYHVGNANGPLLLVNLNKPVARAASSSIVRMPYMGEGDSELSEADKNIGVFWLSQVADGKVIARYDYNDYVNAYSAVCNNDGVYPVDDEMKQFLTLLAGRLLSFGSSADGYQWLLPCQYIQPAEGLPASGSGTENDPFVLIQAKNSISSSTGTVHLSLTAPSGVYMIETSGALACKDAGVTLEKIENLYYVTYTEDTAHSFTLTGAGGTVTVTAVSNLQASGGDDSAGNDAGHAILANSGVFNVIINTEVNANGVYCKIEPFAGGSGIYVIHLPATTLGKVEYNGSFYGAGEDIRINAQVGQSYIFKFTSGTVRPVDCNYMAYIYKEGTSSVVRPLSLGDNRVVLDENGVGGIRYSFTSVAGGYYEISSAAQDAAVGVEGTASAGSIVEQDSVIWGGGKYVFNIAPNGTITFIIGSSDLMATSADFNIKVAATTPELKLGENVINFTDDDIGRQITFKFTAPANAQSNSYTIQISNPAISIDGHGITFDEKTHKGAMTVLPGETVTLRLHKNDTTHDSEPNANSVTIINEEPSFPNAVVVGEEKAIEFKNSQTDNNCGYSNVIKPQTAGSYTVSLSGDALSGKTVTLTVGGTSSVVLNAENNFTASVNLTAEWQQLSFTSDLLEENATFAATLKVSAVG